MTSLSPSPNDIIYVAGQHGVLTNKDVLQKVSDTYQRLTWRTIRAPEVWRVIEAERKITQDSLRDPFLGAMITSIFPAIFATIVFGIGWALPVAFVAASAFFVYFTRCHFGMLFANAVFRAQLAGASVEHMLELWNSRTIQEALSSRRALRRILRLRGIEDPDNPSPEAVLLLRPAARHAALLNAPSSDNSAPGQEEIL